MGGGSGRLNGDRRKERDDTIRDNLDSVFANGHMDYLNGMGVAGVVEDMYVFDALDVPLNTDEFRKDMHAVANWFWMTRMT